MCGSRLSATFPRDRAEAGLSGRVQYDQYRRTEGGLMPDKTDVSRSRLASRLALFYVILAAVTVAVVIIVIDKGRNEKPQPAIAGGYVSAAAAPCIGPAPKPVGGQPLPPTAPTQLPATGPSFNVLQSGQFVNFTNNQNTLGGKLRLNEQTLPGGGHRLTGKVNCVSGGRSLALNAVAIGGAKSSITGTLGGLPFAASLKSAPPPAGAAAPRTPTNVQGTYALSPGSTCFGSKFTLDGTGSVVALSAASKPLGTVKYSSKTGGLAGDVRCTKGGMARITATANDLQLQNVTVIPLNVATPIASKVPTAN